MSGLLVGRRIAHNGGKMKIENTVKVMKQIHPDRILIIKAGTFGYVFGRDAYIIGYLLNYQVKKMEGNYCSCGFPISAINKVAKILDDNQISYMIFIKSENYEIETEEIYKKINI